jgi:RNA polymerase sigma-70 factor, ECF subfamily
MEVTVETLYAAQRGDYEAQKNLMQYLYAPVYHFLQKRIGNIETANELCQQVFLKCFEQLAQYKPYESSMKTWVFVIARNTLIDYYRKVKNEPYDDLTEIPATDMTSDTAREAEEHLMRKYVTTLLIQLDSDEADVVSLRAIDDMPYEEIAYIIDKTEVATRKMYSRALEKLKVLVQKEGKHHTP